MSFNQLKTFDFDFFDQVGTLTSLMVNASYNDLWELSDNTTSFISAREQGKNHKVILTTLHAHHIFKNIFQIYVMIFLQDLFILTLKFWTYLITTSRESMGRSLDHSKARLFHLIFHSII
jgi:hypothetical protein